MLRLTPKPRSPECDADAWQALIVEANRSGDQIVFKRAHVDSLLECHIARYGSPRDLVILRERHRKVCMERSAAFAFMVAHGKLHDRVVRSNRGEWK